MVMLRLLLRSIGPLSSSRAEPSALERWLVHALYLAGLALLAWPVSVARGDRPVVGVEDLIAAPLAVTVAALGLLFWSARTRAVPRADWYLSHLAWLASASSGLLLAAGLAALSLTLGLIFVLVLPPAALLLIYAPYLAGMVVFAWFGARMLHGYVRFWMRAPMRAVAPGLHALRSPGPP